MSDMFEVCNVVDYIEGTIPRPDPIHDPKGASIWDGNNQYAAYLISKNINATQMMHISSTRIASQRWSNLAAVHESNDDQTAIQYIRNLYHTVAQEDTNIPEHLNKLK